MVKNEIQGVSGSLRDDLTVLIEQSPNSRPFGVFGGTPAKFLVPPFTHLLHIHKLGENGTFFLNGYDADRIRTKRDSVNGTFEKKIARAKTDKKKKKIRNRMLKRLDKLDRKIKEGNQLMRWGEKPAVYEHEKSIASSQSMKQYLQSKGYFDAKVTIDTSLLDYKKRTMAVSYEIEPKAHFFIDSIQYIIEDSVLRDLIFENLLNAPLKKSYYDQEILTKERDYIYELAVNNGYFEFSKQYITFEVDSTFLGSDTLFVREIIRNPENQSNHKIYYLDSIVFVSDASLTQTYNRTIENYKDITFSFGKNRYSKKVLQWRIPLEQDDRYSRDLTLETQRQLSYLDNFKFVNINYDTTDRKFVANIFTSAFDKYQTSSEFGIIQNSLSASQLLSPFVNISLKNRNTFNALEIVDINIDGKLEDISTVQGEQGETRYSSQQAGAQLSFNFPQFLFPLGRFYKKKMGLFNPRTRLSVGINFENRLSEYTRTSINSALAYSWQVRNQIKHTLTPLEVNLIDSRNEESFEDFLRDLEEQGSTYPNAFRSAYVNSASYQFEYTRRGYLAGKDGFFGQLFLESGGQFNELLNLDVFRDSIETFQFFKFNIDARKIEKVTRKLNIAYRLNIGVALPYGPNEALPYEKYFFGGGSNSLRAWKPRRLGPGAYGIYQDSIGFSDRRFNEINFDQEQPGELLIQASFEFRQQLVGFLEGAVFFDAGNIWLLRGSTVNASLDPQGDDGKFRFNEFLNEVAVGTGVGFRFDLSFLILRLDLGVKLIDPAQERGKRFVGDEIFRNFGPNSEFNIGIGYPF